MKTMRALRKDQQREKEEHAATIRMKQDAASQAVQGYNALMLSAREAVEKAVGDLNEAINDANEWMSEVHTDQESYYDERSEKWQEGDTGSNYRDWMDHFANEFDEVEIDLPAELDEGMAETSHPETLEELPDNP